MITTTDHKLIGIMYCVACFVFFALGGLMALFMRAELTVPGLQFLSNEQYNQLFTMHGTAMLLFYATPIVFGFANLVLPLQIGAPDVAFPRLNALSFWLFIFGASIALAGFITPGGAADFGWTAYTPLSDAAHTPGAGGDLWILGLAVGGLGTILGAVNMITTVVCMRCPGMTMFRMPIFTWNIFVTSILVLLVFPLLTAALVGPPTVMVAAMVALATFAVAVAVVVVAMATLVVEVAVVVVAIGVVGVVWLVVVVVSGCG
jgi:cytochrome c oxidase subunit 1